MTQTTEELKTVAKLGVELNKKVGLIVGEFIKEHMDEIGTKHNAFLVAGSALSATILRVADTFHPEGMMAGAEEFTERLDTALADLMVFALADKLGIKI